MSKHGGDFKVKSTTDLHLIIPLNTTRTCY